MPLAALISCSDKVPPTVSPPHSAVATADLRAQTTRATVEQQRCAIDPLALLDELRAQHFDQLGTKLQRLADQVVAKTCSDRWLDRALDAFGNTDPTLLPALDGWIQTELRSAFAYAARGNYYQALAWQNRGSAFAGKTPPAQMRAMEALFEQASADLREAINLDPGLTPAHANLIQLAMASSGPLRGSAILRRAMAVAPHSFAVRLAVLTALQPKWGGSLTAIDQFLADTRAYEADDPALNELRGYRAFVEADTLFINQDYPAALVKIEQSLALGNLRTAHVERAWILKSMQRLEQAEREYLWLVEHGAADADDWYARAQIAFLQQQPKRGRQYLEAALKLDGGDPYSLDRRATILFEAGATEAAFTDLNRAIEQVPVLARLYAHRARLHYQLKHNPSALLDIDQALALKPDTAQSWRYRGLILIRLQRGAEALTAFDRAIEQSPDDAQIYYERAWTREKQLHDPNAALTDYRHATDLAPDSANFWWARALVAIDARDCDSLVGARHYVVLCQQGFCGQQDPKRLEWARTQTETPQYAGLCPKEYAEPFPSHPAKLARLGE